MPKRFEQQIIIGLTTIQKTEIPNRKCNSTAAVLEVLKKFYSS